MSTSDTNNPRYTTCLVVNADVLRHDAEQIRRHQQQQQQQQQNSNNEEEEKKENVVFDAEAKREAYILPTRDDVEDEDADYRDYLEASDCDARPTQVNSAPEPPQEPSIFPPPIQHPPVSSSISPQDTQQVNADLVEDFNQIKQPFDTRLNRDYDWNENYQEIFDRNAATPHDQQQRVDRLANDRDAFIIYATKVGMAVISTKIYPEQQQPPLVQQDMNVGGIAGGAKFIVGNVMFKFAVNDNGVYANEIEAQKAAALEVKATSALVELNSSHIHTTLTCIVRYRGFCVYAIALAPLDCLAYGSQNAGTTVEDASNWPGVRTAIDDLGTQLHLREHGVFEKLTKTVKRLCMPVDIEVHIGKDGRFYILDTARLFPPTPPRASVKSAYLTRHFRPEFMLRLRQVDGMPRLSSDAYSRFSMPDERALDFRDVDRAYAYLHQQVIPELARTLVIDAGGDDVAAQFHAMGVNMRYMPSVAFHCTDESVRVWLCEEMIIRCLKVRIRHSWIDMVRCSNRQLLDALCTRLGSLFSKPFPRSETSLMLDAVFARYADNGDEVMDELEPVLDAISERETNWPLVTRVLRALNIEFDDDDSLTVINSVEGLHQHRASWRLVPEVTCVKPHAYVPLNEREAQLKAVIELREQSNLSVVQPLLQLLELYRVWSDEEAEASRTNGLKVAKRLLGIVASAAASYDMAMVLNDVGEFYRHFQIIDRQLSVCEQAVNMMRGLLLLLGAGSSSSESGGGGGGDRRQLQGGLSRVLNAMGMAYSDQARYDDAKRVYEEALEIVRELYGEDSTEVATTLNNMAVVFDYQGVYAKALEYYERALAIRTRVLGDNHPEVAMTLNNMAIVFRNQGEYAKALEHFERALVIRTRVLGDNHPSVAATLNSMAVVFDNQGEYAKALEQYERALAIRTQVLGDNHPNVATTLNNMAIVFDAQGEYAKALEHYERALAIYTRVLGDNHPDVAETLYNIGLLHQNRNSLTDALSCFERAHRIWSATLPPGHQYLRSVTQAINEVRSALV